MTVDWITADGLVDYEEALAFMEDRVAAIHDGAADECVWLVEHPPLYTAGTSADPSDLVDPDRFPVFDAGRGGQYTYHGPGQRTAYVMLNLNQGGPNRAKDVRAYVHNLEEWIIRTIASFGVDGGRREGRVGIWVDMADGTEAKIAAIGVRVRKWVTFHGIAINVAPDLSHFDGIVPCGIAEHGVTSLKDLGIDATMADVDAALKAQFDAVFSA